MAATIGTRLHSLFFGKKVGEDEFGNKYYTEKKPSVGERKKRWVIYNGSVEPSKVPPLWRGWLHYNIDELPDNKQKHGWMKPHLPNLTGTKGAYFPKGHIRNNNERAKSTSDYESWSPEA